MSDESKIAPCILISKRYQNIIKKFNYEEIGKLFSSVFDYALENKEPINFPRDLEVIFLMFKSDIDMNEERYKAKRQRNKEDYERRKAEKNKTTKKKEKPPDEPKKIRQNKKAEQNKMNTLTPEQEDFLKEFKQCLPNKETNCELSDFPNINYASLIKSIKESPQFLMNTDKNKAFDLRWYLENADKIIAGNYKKFEEEQKESVSKSRVNQEFTVEELDRLSGQRG